MEAPLPPNEPGRLKALYAHQILDTEPEPGYDLITTLAALTCEAPMALVTLIDADRQWFKSTYGVDSREGPRAVSFCAHAILRPDEPLVVEDCLEDKRFSDNPFVTGPTKYRFYAGVPICDSNRVPLGTLCVADTKPRQLSEKQLTALKDLARLVEVQLEMRTALLDAQGLTSWFAERLGSLITTTEPNDDAPAPPAKAHILGVDPHAGGGGAARAMRGQLDHDIGFRLDQWPAAIREQMRRVEARLAALEKRQRDALTAHP